MFDLVRNHKRWMLFLVLILILPSFVFFGIEGYARFMDGEQAMAKVAGGSVTRAEYDAARRNQLDRARQMLGGAFDPLLFDTPEMREETLNQLIDARVIAAAAADGHFTVSNNVLRQAIAGIPAIQTNGRFDPELYTQALAMQGITPAQFEASLRYDLAQSLVLQPVADSGIAPRSLVEDLLQAMGQQRTVRLRTFHADEHRANVAVSDADVQQYYEANAARFHIPEVIDAQYVLLDSEAAKRGVTVTDDEIAAYYEQNKQRFTNPETRSVSHILLLVPEGANEAERTRIREQAQQLVTRAQADPTAFAELAKAESQDVGTAEAGGSLGQLTRDTMVPEFERVAFALAEGEVSDVVQTDFGYHIIKADQVSPATVKSLPEVRDQLAEEIRLQKAGDRFGTAASRLTELVYDQADSLQPVAEALDLEVRTAQGIARDAAPADSPDIFQDPRVRLALFSTEVARESRNSGVIELAPDRLVAVRAERVVPAHTAALADVADDIRQQLSEERALQAARAAGEAALQALRDGGSVEGAGFAAAITVTRADPAGVEAEVLQAIMAVPQNADFPVYTGAVASSGYVLAMVESVTAGEAPIDDAIRAEQAALGNALAQAQVDVLLRDLRNRYKVRIEPVAAEIIAESSE